MKEKYHLGVLTFRIFAFAFMTVSAASAQIGFNNPNPDPSSVIDIKATDRGLLIPRLNTVQRDLMVVSTVPPAHSLLVFDTDQKLFYYFDATATPAPGKWIALNTWFAESAANANTILAKTGNVGIGTQNPVTKLDVNGVITAQGLNMSGFSSNSLVPTGAIIMWSGDISSIPMGWALCDGSNETPDLRDRFIVGAGSSYFPNSTGGQKEIALIINQLPPHTHTPGTLNIISSGGHEHTSDGIISNSKAVGKNSTGTGESAQNPGASGATISGTGVHIHASTYFRGETGSVGTGQPIENRPPYFALAFIMKLP